MREQKLGRVSDENLISMGPNIVEFVNCAGNGGVILLVVWMNKIEHFKDVGIFQTSSSLDTKCECLCSRK